MADDSWRQAFRAWEATPDDPAVVARAITAARRAAQPIPLELLERDRYPASRFVSRRAFLVFVQPTPEEDEVDLAETPGEVAVPACHAWWVRPIPARADAAVIEEVRRAEAPGLSLERAHVSAEGIQLATSLGPQLRRLSLKSCTRLEPGALNSLLALPALDTLELSGAGGVDRAALEAVRQIPTLARLGLGNLKAFNQECLDGLAGHPNLSVLSLRNNPALGEAGLQPLATLPLRELNLDNCKKAPDAAIASLVKSLPRLRRISLANCARVRGKTTEALGGLPGLKGLVLRGCGEIKAKHLAPLARSASLELLEFSSHLVKDDQIEALTPLAPTLRSLDVSQNSIEQRGIDAISKLSRLRSLRLHFWRPVDLTPLAQLAELDDLAILGDADQGECNWLSDLARCPLRRLFLRDATAEAGARIARFAPTLEYLRLHVPIDFASMAPSVARLRALRTLDVWLRKEEPTVQTLSVLASLPQLSELHLRGIKEFGDSSLQILSTYPALEALTLETMPSHTTTPDGLEALARLPRLRRLMTDLPIGKRAAAALCAIGCRVVPKAAKP